MTRPEQAGHQECRWPKADSRGECVLNVSTKRELLKESDQEERYCPCRKRGENCDPMHRQAGNTEAVKQEHSQQSTGDREEAQQRSKSKVLSKSLTERQAVLKQQLPTPLYRGGRGGRRHEN